MVFGKYIEICLGDGTAVFHFVKTSSWAMALPKAFQTNGTVGSFHSPTSSVGTLPKAFQTNTTCSFGFFAPRLFTKASFRHSLETKKPLICMRGFVANIGASLEEFAGDIRAILDAKLKNR